MNAVDELLSAVNGATVIDLEHERYVGASIFPAHWPGFVYTLHRHHEAGTGQPRTSASGTVTMQEHSGTHIDALCHQAIDMEMSGSVAVGPQVQTPRGFTELGIETVGPIVRRGVLLDVAAARGVDALPAEYVITAEDLEHAATAQSTALQPGDCVLVRTGAGRDYGNPETYLRGAGVGSDGAQWLAGHHPYLCGADNTAFDVPTDIDPELGSLPSHSVLIVRHGIYIVENLALEELSQRRAYEFMFVCIPLKMRGVTGSPVRPLAVIP